MKMKFELPQRAFNSKDTKLISIRIPEALLWAIDGAADARGWSRSEVMFTVLDQAMQQLGVPVPPKKSKAISSDRKRRT